MERLLQDYIESQAYYIPSLGTGACEHQLGLGPTHIPQKNTNMGSDGILFLSFLFLFFFYNETGLALLQHYKHKGERASHTKRL